MSKNIKIGVVGIPGKWSTETLADAVEAATGYRLVIDMSEVSLNLADKSLWFQGQNLCELDGIIVKKISSRYSPNTIDRLELLRLVEASGVKVFSPVASMIRLIDRLSCTVTMRNANIPMPATTITESRHSALMAIQDYDQAVFKPLFSTKARGMVILEAARPEKKLLAQIDEFQQQNPMMYIQQKKELSGQDLGMVFLGGQYLCTYARVSQNSAWNTTINSGGKYAEYQPDDALIELGKKAHDLFDLDFTTVDIALTDEGPIVFEVSAFGGFRGVLEGCGIDAAKAYVDYAIEKISI